MTKLKKLNVKISKELYKIIKDDAEAIDLSLDETVELIMWEGMQKIMDDCDCQEAIKNSGKHL
jgi:predicted HicB family RNase H-like nuclease